MVLSSLAFRDFFECPVRPATGMCQARCAFAAWEWRVGVSGSRRNGPFHGAGPARSRPPTKPANSGEPRRRQACLHADLGVPLALMAKLYFHYSTMNAGKSTVLLQAAHNYRERGMQCYLMTAQFDNRAGQGRIASRIGIGQDADTFAPDEDLFAKIKTHLATAQIACIFIDEAQFLSDAQVWQLARAVDDLKVPIMCYGLRVDFQGKLFPGSATLLALADEMREVRTICHCGKKASMVVRQDAQGNVVKDGAQVQIGGNETYVSLCRRHWRKATGDTA